MKELLELAKNLDVSRPVFRLTIDSSGAIDANISNPVYRYRPSDSEDVLAQLITDNYQESFSLERGTFSVDRDQIARRSMEDIRTSIAQFVESNLEMRNPRQSKLYKWLYRNMPNNSEFNDTLVLLYKYLRTFTGDKMRATSDTHMNNALALLTAMEEKYNEQR